MPATLSLILPNYNHGEYIGEALDAVLSQSRVPDEVIVIDDASTDDSVPIIESFAKRVDNIVLIRNAKNKGCMACNNEGRMIAKGDYLVGLSADDVPLPGLYEKSMNMLNRFPSAAFCCSDIMLHIGDCSAKLVHRSAWMPQEDYMSGGEYSERLPLGPLHTHTVVARRDLFWKYGGFDEGLSYHADWFLYLCMAFRHGLCYIPEALGMWRLLDGSWSSKGIRDYSKQAAIMARMLLSLEAEAKDVAPRFARSGALRMFSSCIDRYMEENPNQVDSRFRWLFEYAINVSLRERENEQLAHSRYYQNKARLAFENNEKKEGAINLARALERYADIRTAARLSDVLNELGREGGR